MSGRAALAAYSVAVAGTTPGHIIVITMRTFLKKVRNLLLAAGGAYLFYLFATQQITDTTTIIVCIIGFVAGGVRFTIGNDLTGRKLETSPADAVGFAAAIACGPIGAAGPAVMAGLGGTLLRSGMTLRTAIIHISAFAVKAAITGFVFTAFGGDITSPAGFSSLVATVAAGLSYFILGWLSGSEAASAKSEGLALGAGYALAGMVRALPVFSVLLAALPLAVTLLGLLKQEKRQSRIVSEPVKTDMPEPLTTKTSFIDPTTGVANQRYLEMFLHQEISRAERSHQQVTVLLVDIDDFDKLNRSEGRESADLCLTAIAEGLKNLVREYDLVARQKDDEFVVVLPDTSAQAGYDTAVRLHTTLSGRVLPHRAKFSIGVATYPEYGLTVDDLLSSANHALNRAKFSGKNSVRSCHTLAKAS